MISSSLFCSRKSSTKDRIVTLKQGCHDPVLNQLDGFLLTLLLQEIINKGPSPLLKYADGTTEPATALIAIVLGVVQTDHGFLAGGAQEHARSTLLVRVTDPTHVIFEEFESGRDIT